MLVGTFINFLIPFNKDGRGLSAEDQAKAILQKGQELIKSGAKGVGILFSANYGQTCTIEETYQKGEWLTGTDGAHQAKVMCLMESLLNTDIYKRLQGKVRIVPITTMNAYDPAHLVKPWNDRVHLEIVKTDLGKIKTYLEEGWDILGWQNQETIKNSRHPYAIGGGVARISTNIANEIQDTLLQYALNFKN
jgi:hypothetical protein